MSNDSDSTPSTTNRATMPRPTPPSSTSKIETTEGKKEPVVDLSKPEQRFQLTGIVKIGDDFKAQVRDGKTGKTSFYDVGDELAQFSVDEIDVQRKSVILLGKTSDKVTLKIN